MVLFVKLSVYNRIIVIIILLFYYKLKTMCRMGLCHDLSTVLSLVCSSFVLLTYKLVSDELKFGR